MKPRLLFLLFFVPAFGQQPFVARPKSNVLWRPYQTPEVPPSRLTNSDKLHGLIRAGKLYLTLQDAIAMAIENNLDIAVQRFLHPIAEADVLRASSGQIGRAHV